MQHNSKPTCSAYIALTNEAEYRTAAKEFTALRIYSKRRELKETDFDIDAVR